MALPLALPTTDFLIDGKAHYHLLASASDKVYIICSDNNGGSTNAIDIYSSADPATTQFAVVDASGNPLSTPDSAWSGDFQAHLVQDGDEIYAFCIENASAENWFDFSIFYTSDHATLADTWDNTVVNEQGYDRSFGGAAHAVRSDGDILSCAVTDSENIMGTGYGRVCINRRESGSWTLDVHVSTLGKVEEDEALPACAIGTSDRLSVTWIDTTNGAINRSIYGSDNVFDSQETEIDTGLPTSYPSFGGSLERNMHNMVALDWGATKKVRVIYESAAGDFSVAGWDDDGTTAAPTASVVADLIPDNADVSRAILMAHGDVQHILYNRDAGDATIIYHTQTGAQDDTWETDTSEFDSASTVVLFSAQIFDYGNGDVIGYLYTDGGAEYYNEKALPLTLNMNVGTLTFSGLDPAVTRQIPVDMGLGTLSVTGYTLTVTESVPVNMDLGSLTFSGLGPTITRQLRAEMAAGGLTFSGLDPAVTRQIPVDMDLGALALSGLDPTVTRQLRAEMAAGSLTLTGLDPTVTRQLRVEMDAGALTFTGYNNTVTVDTGTLVSMDLGALTLSGLDPTVTRQLRAEMDAGALTFTGLDPAVTRQLPVSMDLGSLTFSGLDPTVTRQLRAEMDAGGLTFSGLDLTVVSGSIISMDAGALTFTGLDPAVTRQIPVSMDLGALTFSGLDPTITRQLRAEMDAGALTFSGLELTIAEAIRVSMDLGALTFSGLDPALIRQLRAEMDAGAFTFSGLDLALTRQIPVSMGLGAFSLVGYDPSLSFQTIIDMDVGALSFDAYSMPVWLMETPGSEAWAQQGVSTEIWIKQPG